MMEKTFTKRDLDSLEIVGQSPQDMSMLRVEHTQARVEVQTPADTFFNAFSR